MPSSPHPYRPADARNERRWEFIWWGFGKKARLQRGFDPDTLAFRSWKLGPIEIRFYEEARKPHSGFEDEGDERPIRRLPGPGP